MVNSGFHKSDVWKSIIMQLMIGLYVMQIHNIAFDDFSVENNVYIKDLSAHNNINKYWKYKIDGLEYYVPNYGYLLLIDSNYGDLQYDTDTLAKKEKKHKIYSETLFNSKNGIMKTQDDINNKCFEIFKSAIGPNVFTNAFIDNGGTKPSEDIISLLSKIYNESSTNANKDIEHYILSHMSCFLNNRIGTYLKDNEVGNIKQGVPTKFIKGQIIACLVEYDTYKFVLYIGPGNTGKNIVLSKNNPDDTNMVQIEVPNGNLFYYSDHNITQNYKAGEIIFNDESLLETYIINKNK